MKNLLLVLFLFLSTISTAFATDLSNLAQCAPYDFTVPGDCNWGVGDGSFSREWLDKNYNYRIRQNGTIKGIRAYFGDLKGVTEFYVKIWRYNDTTAKYDLIGVSENLIDKISSNQINDVILDSPIAEVQEGDYYGGRIVGDNGVQLVAKPLPVDPAWGLYYETDSPSIVSGYNWEASPSVAGWGCPIEFFMDPPSLVYIGDSLIYENVAFTMPASLSGGYGLISTTIPYKVGQNLQRRRPVLKPTIYQNMGIGGQITSQIASRFAVDVLAKHPQIAVIEGGTNDLISGTISKDQFLVNWKTMLDACAANGIKVMVLLIWPGDATDIYGNALLTNEKMVMRDDWNAALTALSETYHNSRVVNVDSFIGQYRPGGPPGNLWDLIPAYTSDHLHLTEAGYAQVARALSMALSPTCPAIPLLLLN